MHPHPFHPPSYMAHILAANSLCPTSRRCAPLRLCFVYAFAGCWFRALSLVGGAGAELGKAEDALKLTEAETAHARTELKRERASLQAHNPSRPCSPCAPPFLCPAQKVRSTPLSHSHKP